MNTYRISMIGLLLAASFSSQSESLPDPTRPPGIRNAAAAGVQADGPVLQSILVGPDRRFAIINGRAVQVGEKLGDAEVVAIDEEQVTLRDGNRTRHLTLYPVIYKRKTDSQAGMPQ